METRRGLWTELEQGAAGASVELKVKDGQRKVTGLESAWELDREEGRMNTLT